MEKPVRKRMRLEEHDYSIPGAYFITICSHERIPIFGEIREDIMNLSRLGEIVDITWKNLPQYFNVQIDDYVIMPNHLHGILWVNQPNNDKPDTSLISIIKLFKALSTKRAHTLGYSQPLWQRSYYETILRDQDHLSSTRFYIQNNPVNWLKDNDYIHPQM